MAVASNPESSENKSPTTGCISMTVQSVQQIGQPCDSSESYIHNFGVNSHLIKVSAGHVASMGVSGFRCENTPFGWQKALREPRHC